MFSMAQQQYQQQYLNQMQGLGRAASAPMNIRGQRFAGHPQQNLNNTQRPAGNMGPPPSRMAPPVGDMGPPPRNTGPLPAGNMSTQNYGRINPTTGQPMPVGLPAGQNMPRQTTSGAFYNSHPNFIAPAHGALDYQRIRHVTTQMLTELGLSESSVINHYQQEIEYIRQLQMDRAIMTSQDNMSAYVGRAVQQQVNQVRGSVSLEAIELVLTYHGLIRPTQRAFAGFSGDQGGGGQRPASQQAGPQQGPSQQGGPQQGGVQQPAAPPAPEESITEEPAP